MKPPLIESGGFTKSYPGFVTDSLVFAFQPPGEEWPGDSTDYYA
jgi:hypothetical protein